MILKNSNNGTRFYINIINISIAYILHTFYSVFIGIALLQLPLSTDAIPH